MSKRQLQIEKDMITNERYVIYNNKGDYLVGYNLGLGKQLAYKYAKMALKHSKGNSLYFQDANGQNQLLDQNT
tara:strand:- start:548 stop:766 length:219 start_codon:yes stop_codon:yes gene_type:complete